MSFAGLPAITQLRQYRCTVLQWAGKIISAADDPNKIVVAIADAMTALNAAYVKCEIIQSNISNLAIQYQETADGGLAMPPVLVVVLLQPKLRRLR
ncbi:hypothetical protein GGI13_000123 [Coemansia sp. RSA 455]|nr:hypothetical protein GGI13_000123 [Coemansia sp. RSA 455]